ncbi:MAG: Gfo/Idh/MocA family oxidoreductase [Isosphaeraceae bacterium]|nr:Gfo/Idh/MocA family oxidoreductase [Isosphaeraceae bacterium]
MSPPAPLRGALIGCGFVSQFHLAAWTRATDARLVALCDLNPERLAQAGAIVPEARRYTDAAAMFAAEPLDFVEICTRPDSHRALTELAARHGVHVLCQKPAAETREDLLAMIAACDRAQVRLMIHENWRFRPWYRALRAEIDAGVIGRPIRLRLSHRDQRALVPGGFGGQPFFAEMPRLMLFEMGPHLIDTARYLLGEVRSVFAALGRFGGHAGEDLATLLLQFESGALGLLDMSWCSPSDLYRPEWALNDTVVEGTGGALRLRLDGALDLIRLDGRIERRPVALPPDDEVYLDGYVATQAHFLAGLRHGTPHETSGTETLKTMDIIWAGYRSAEEGRNIDLS